MKQLLKLGVAAALGLSLLPAVDAATYTDGKAQFTVTFTDPPGNYDRRVDAFWVTDAAGTFIVNVRKDANRREEYLNHWETVRTTTAIEPPPDGYTGATISSWTPVTVTWDCRDAANNLLPDGDYKFWVEFTDKNNTGWWTPNGIQFTKGPTGVTNTYPDQSSQYLSGMRIAYWVIPPPHDIAVVSLFPPAAQPDSLVNVRVVVTNAISAVETNIAVTLSNLTTASLIGSQSIASLAGNTATTLTFNWDTTGLALGDYALKATAGPVPAETSIANNSRTNLVTLRLPTHDVTVNSITTPSLVVPGTTTNVTVVAGNTGDFAESFTVRLFDDTDGRVLGTNQVNNLASFSTTSLLFSWRATNSSIGNHLLRAVAASVAGEADLLDNTNFVVVPVASGLETNTFIARSNLWRYNDTGTDLTATPWRESWYYDEAWKAGLAPLGYGQTNIATTNSFGANGENKRPTYYYRKAFYVDVTPLTLRLLIRRDDGFVIYINGRECLRDGMPSGPIGYSTLATNTVSGADQYTYFTFTIDPTNVVVGENVLAAEVHQVLPSSSDIAWDLQLTGTRPNIAPIHNVAVLEMVPSGDVTAGDKMTISVTATNQGTATETFLLVIRDNTANKVVATKSVTNVVPQASVEVTLDWKTVLVSVGEHELQAYAVVNGVTNVVGTALATARVATTGIGLNAVNATGSLGGRYTAVANNSSNLVLGAGATLEVWNRSNALSPVKSGALRLPGMIEGITLAGYYAYVACGSAGIQVVDLTNPSAPVHRNTLNTSGHSYGSSVYGIYLFVADGRAGVRVFNIANPAQPTLVGAYYTEGPARAVQYLSSYLYVVDQFKGLQVLSTANPTAPTAAGAFNGIDAGQTLGVARSIAHVTDAYGKLWLINVATPSAPTLITNLQLNALPQGAVVNSNVVYVAAGDSGLLTINAATAANPIITATNSTPGAAADVAFFGTTAYVAGGFGGFQVLNISTPSAPAWVADYATGLRAADVAIANNLAYVAAGEAGFRIYNLSNSTAPVLVGSLPSVANARNVALSGSVAYVGDGQYGLKIVDISNPASPSLLGALTIPDLDFVRSVAASGSQVALTDGKKICLVDASVPANPVLRATFPAPGFAYALAFADSRVYAACGNHGLLILDASSSTLTLAGTYDTAGLATSVSVAGTNAYVADNSSGWLVLDVSNPAAPALINTFAGQGPVQSLAVSGVLAALGGGNAVNVMDVTTPLTPVSKQSFGPVVRALRVAAGGQWVATAEDEAGIAILDASGDIDKDGLPDAWELEIVNANPNDAIRNIADVRPNDDFDGDGASNYAEFMAGTSPSNAGSKFVLTVQGGAPATPVTIQWSSVANKLYTVYKSTNLAEGFSVLEDNIAATPPLNTYTDPASGEQAYYLIRVR